MKTRNIHLSPDAPEGGSPGGTGSAPSGGIDPTEFSSIKETVGRFGQDFESLRGDTREMKEFMQEMRGRFSPSPKEKSDEVPFPDVADAKYGGFKTPEQVRKFEYDKRAHFKFLDKKEAAEEKAKESQGRSVKELEEADAELDIEAADRMDEYSETNPEFSKKLAANKGQLIVKDPGVYRHIKGSEFYPQILEHLCDNKEDLKELNKKAERGDSRGVLRLITKWELSAERMEAEKANPTSPIPGFGSRIPSPSPRVSAGVGKLDLAARVKALRN